MWDRKIDMPSGNLSVKDVLDILKASLDDAEIKQAVEELLGWPSKGYDVMDAHDYEFDV